MKIEVREETIRRAVFALSDVARDNQYRAECIEAEDVREWYIDRYFQAYLAREELQWAQAYAAADLPEANVLLRLPTNVECELERYRQFGHPGRLGAIAGALRLISLETMEAAL